MRGYELSLGIYDSDGHHLRGVPRNPAADYDGGARFGKRGGYALYYHDGSDVFLGGTDADCGKGEGLSRRMRPVLHFLFPDLPQEHPANEYIATNMIANVFGLGWAATPAGLKAMEALQERNLELCGQKGTSRKRGPDIATDEMCTFLIVNISSLQLIPVNIIAYRSQYGSVNPAAVVGPGLIATICSTAAAIIFCKLKKRC